MNVTERQKHLINSNAQKSAEILEHVIKGNKTKAQELIQDQRNILEALELEVR